jgi:tripartite-type tricarboxylate transporter receptor subunit TctC
MKPIPSLLLSWLLLTLGVTHAQTYPDKPIRLIVPSAAGGSVDRLARSIGQRLGDKLGQPVVVDNRPGGGGTVATENVATAKPDGYTLLIGTIAGLATNVSFDKVKYDPIRDFAPITLVGLQDFVLCANATFGAKSIPEIIEIAKSNTQTVTYASAGKGTGSHLSGELFNQLTGVEMIHVPYKGMSQATADVVGGQVTFAFASISTALPLIKVKRLIPIAVTGKKRSPMLPDIPTVAEAGVKGYESSTWYGIVVPIETPQAIQTLLNKEIVLILKDPELRKIYDEEGLELVGNTQLEFKSFIQKEIDKWRRVATSAGLKKEPKVNLSK